MDIKNRNHKLKDLAISEHVSLNSSLFKIDQKVESKEMISRNITLFLGSYSKLD